MEVLKNVKWVLFFSVLIFSCNFQFDEKLQELHNSIKYKKKYFSQYQSIYKLANDSISKWVHDSLGVTQACFFNNYELDSIFIFNESNSRFYTSVNIIVGKNRYAVFDELMDFGGAKIDGKWYFFFMNVSRPVRREDWQDSVYAPLSFEELSYVAYDNLFKTLVKKH